MRSHIANRRAHIPLTYPICQPVSAGFLLLFEKRGGHLRPSDSPEQTREEEKKIKKEEEKKNQKKRSDSSVTQWTSMMPCSTDATFEDAQEEEPPLMVRDVFF